MKKNQKVLLVNPFPLLASAINEATIYPPLGIAYIAGYLESKGVECRIIDANLFRLGQTEILKRIKEFGADVIGISTNIVTIRAAIKLSQLIKNHLPVKVILGGPSADASIKNTLQESLADCIVIGEGERISWNLVNNGFDLKNTKGIVYIEDSEIKINPREDYIKDLDELPFPAWHLLPNLKLYMSKSRKRPVATMITSRGCPYRCIFCHKSIFGNQFRKRSVQNILDEIDLLRKNFKVRQIDLVDDNFTLDIPRAEKILDTITERNYNIALSLPNGVRADRLTPQLVRKMKLAGVYRAGLGIESGDEMILENIGKDLKLKHATEAIKMFRKENIIVSGFFMLGLPDDTRQTMQKTIDFAIKVNPHVANFSITVPLPGTELFDVIKKRGRFVKSVEEGISRGFFSISNGYFEIGELKKEDVFFYQRQAYRKFYIRPFKLLEVLLTIRTFQEFKWIFTIALPLLRGLISPKREDDTSPENE
ncbi:B12-binding domain-containing radical SAM protein [candidate division CSSED10-310 bacterium]|uniref:B12-binding domain-containing radical SAM protein n=1 Tax=candidate division CSSED10-310 bacterium TaxID=2855610 RepID=A0ABV6YSX8_UNCC1